MTNAQAALIAAATWYAGDDTSLETVLGYADRMESHLDARGRQEATSPPWVDDGVRRCSECGTTIVRSLRGRYVDWRDRSGRMGTSSHRHHP